MPRRQPYPEAWLHAFFKGMTIDQVVAADWSDKIHWKPCDDVFDVEAATAIGDAMEVPSLEKTFVLVGVNENGMKLFLHLPDGEQLAVRPYPRFRVNIWSTDFAPDSGFFKVKFAAIEEVSGCTHDYELRMGQFSTVLQAWESIRRRCMVGFGHGTWWCVAQSYHTVSSPLGFCIGKLR